MNLIIALLESQRAMLINNSMVNTAEGKDEQAEMERKTVEEINEVLGMLTTPTA